MISDNSNKTLTVLINIDVFLINNNIKNNEKACKSKQKDYNLVVGC